MADIKDMSTISLLLEKKFGVSITDHNGTIIYVNKLFRDLSKYDEEELIGANYGLLNPDYTAERFVHEMKQTFKKNKVWQQQLKCIAKDGSPYWSTTTIVPLHDENGAIIQFISLDIDITAKVIAGKSYKKTLGRLLTIESALDHSSSVTVTNQQGVILHANDNFCKTSKYSAEELIGQTHRVINSGFHPKSYFKNLWKTIGNGEIWMGELKNRAKDGTEYWVNTTIVPLLDKNKKPQQFISIRTDITDRKEAEQALKLALKNDFRQTVKNLQNAIFKYTAGPNGGIIFTLFEGKTAEKFGITVENIMKYNLWNVYSEDETLQYYQYLMTALQGEAAQFEVRYQDHAFLVYLSPIFENNTVVEVVGTATDITAHKEAERLVEHMAYYDHLTGLPNRRVFHTKVHEVIEQSGKSDETFAVMFIDLDRFKSVNDSLGHTIGDQLLILVAERLRHCVRKKDIVARLGGDEYVILLPDTTTSVAQVVASRIVEEMSKPFVIDDHDVLVSSSIGISLFPEDGSDYDTLMTNADSAMYLVKDNGKNNFQFFTEELHRSMVEKTMMEIELRQALKRNQFELQYQPLFNLKTGKLTGLETHILWQHPLMGTISPTDFIPIAEEIGLIEPIGQWILETACLQMKKWHSSGHSQLKVHVNTSLQKFKQPLFVTQLKETLAKTGLQSEFLTLDFTESITSDKKDCAVHLRQLRDLGVGVSIDNFGTSPFSLSCLTEFPITHLKIDRTFVQQLSTTNQALIQTIITLAKVLNLTVVAKGVETVEQERFLQDVQCDEVQGSFYSKSLPTEQVEEYLRGML
ncbi:EAL domain-containing protein [Sporosarcina sp. NPDC096371]|uniref:EAL domain-containing protein n=1 Tax=Sporosarcina sp. NPDC096371 TaxID=3364530 RepID=UPI0037FBDC66